MPPASSPPRWRATSASIAVENASTGRSSLSHIQTMISEDTAPMAYMTLTSVRGELSLRPHRELTPTFWNTLRRW